jgi:hypothetical protein
VDGCVYIEWLICKLLGHHHHCAQNTVVLAGEVRDGLLRACCSGLGKGVLCSGGIGWGSRLNKGVLRLTPVPYEDLAIARGTCRGRGTCHIAMAFQGV